MKIEWKNCFKIGVSVLLLYICIRYITVAEGFLKAFIGASSPLVLGACIAYILNILLNVYEKHFFPKSKKSFVIKLRRPVCIFGAFLTLAGIIALIISLIVPQLVMCVKLILWKLPEAFEFIAKFGEQLNVFSQETMDFLESTDWQSKIGDMIDMFTSGIGNVMDAVVNVVSATISGTVFVIVGVIFSVYILFSKEKIAGQTDRVMKHFLNEEKCGKIRYVLGVLNECFHNFIVGQCTEALILGVLCTVGMAVLKLPYAPMIGALIAFTSLIPVAGAYVGGALACFMILTVSPVQALIFLVFLCCLQQVEGNIIYPKVVGSSIGLPGIWVLAAVTIGGGLLGIFGMLLGVPVAAAAYRLLKENID